MTRALLPLVFLFPLALTAAPAATPPPPARPTATPATAPAPVGQFSVRNVVDVIDDYEVPYLELSSTHVTFKLSQPSLWQSVNDQDGAATFILRGYPRARISFRVLPKSGFISSVDHAAMDSYASGLLVTHPESKGHQITFHNLGDYAWTKEAGSVVSTSKKGVEGFSLRLQQRPFGTTCGRLDYTVTTTEPSGKTSSLRTLDILSDLGDHILVSSYSNTPDVFANPNLDAFQNTILKGIAVKGFPPPPPPKTPPKTPAKPGNKPNPDDTPAEL